MVDTYGFLMGHLNTKLDWSDNTETFYRKGQSRRLSAFSSVLRRWHRERWCHQAEQTGEESWLCGGDETGQCGGGDREEDERKAASYNGQTLSISLRRAEATQAHVQLQTHPTSCLKALGGLFHAISDRTIKHLHHSSQHLPPPLIKDTTIHFTATKTDCFLFLLSFIISGTLHFCTAVLPANSSRGESIKEPLYLYVTTLLLLPM